MKSIVMVIVMCATVAYAGDWNKTYEGLATSSYYENRWIPLPTGKSGQILQYNETENPPIKWVDQKLDEITITDLNYVDKICFDIYSNDAQTIKISNKRCVSVKWLYEFLSMMGR